MATSSSSEMASIDGVSPSLLLADDCSNSVLLAQANDVIMLLGQHLSPTSNFYLTYQEPTKLDCILGGHTTALCYGVRRLACQMLQQVGRAGPQEIDFDIQLEMPQDRLTTRAASLRISAELPRLSYLGHDYQAGCQFWMADQARQELSAASRGVLCVYNSYGQSFVGDLLDAGENSVVCPLSKNFFQHLEVSIFATGPLGSMVNLTTAPCIFSKPSAVSPQLAWINPPALACGV